MGCVEMTFWILFGFICGPVIFLLIKGLLVAVLEGWRTDAVNTPRADTGGITFEQMWGVIQGDSFAASRDGDDGDEVKPWDVDLGEFLKDAEEDAHAQTMQGAAGEFDPDTQDAGILIDGDSETDMSVGSEHSPLW